MIYKTELTHHKFNQDPKLKLNKKRSKYILIDFFLQHPRGAGYYYYHPYHYKLIGPFSSHEQAHNDFLTIPNIERRKKKDHDKNTY